MVTRYRRDERQFRSSSHREKVVEHLFLGELLRYLWVSGVDGVQVLKPEVDAAGYDIVLSLGPVVRHVQLKSSQVSGRTQSQLIHESLATHASGCVIWVLLDEQLKFVGFRWFGGEPGKPLPPLTRYRRARHARANAQGIKAERAHTWRVPRAAFETVADMAGVVGKLFG